MYLNNFLLSSLSHEVNTRYAANHYSFVRPNKAVGQKLFNFIGTQIYN